MRLAVAALLVLLAVACDGAATAKPAASPQPSAATTPLFAVLETPPGQYGMYENDAVTIVGLDGHARAKTHFTPRSRPYGYQASIVLVPEAHVAAGGTYFVDGAGVVRVLYPYGVVRQVATFPITQSQQAISFAVSPDGHHLVAALLTVPAYSPTPSPGCEGLGSICYVGPTQLGPWKLEVDSTDAGGVTRTLHQWTATSYPGQPGGFVNIVMAGWDAQVPVAAVGSGVATQNGPGPGQQFLGGHFANIDTTTGLPGPRIGSCEGNFGNFAGPWSVSANGTRICLTYDPTTAQRVVTVEAPGLPAWKAASWTGPPYDEGGFVLSADGTKLALRGAVVGRDGTSQVLPKSPDFEPQGWLDANTLIGVENKLVAGVAQRRMSYVSLSNPLQANDLGFAGRFVGVVVS